MRSMPVKSIKSRLGDLQANFHVEGLTPDQAMVTLFMTKKPFPKNKYLSDVKLKKVSLYDNPFFKDTGDEDDGKPNPLFGSGEDSSSKFFTGGETKKDEPKPESAAEKSAREKREADQRKREIEDQKLQDLKDKLPF